MIISAHIYNYNYFQNIQKMIKSSFKNANPKVILGY